MKALPLNIIDCEYMEVMKPAIDMLKDKQPLDSILNECESVLSELENIADSPEKHMQQASAIFVIITIMLKKSQWESVITYTETMLGYLKAIEDKKNIDFLILLSALLHNRAYAHFKLELTEQGEHELNQAATIVKYLHRKNKSRFARFFALTNTYQAEVLQIKQKCTEALIHYQAASDIYKHMVKEDIGDKECMRYVEILIAQGRIMMAMKKWQKAGLLFHNALVEYKKIIPQYDLRQIEISAMFGSALLHRKPSFDAGKRLLELLIAKSEELGMTELRDKIEKILNDAIARNQDDKPWWRKIFTIAVISMLTISANAQMFVGHRGSIWGVENTKEAFENGVKAGYGALECDVRVTTDGVFVISHDTDLGRLGHKDIEVEKCTSKQLLKLPLTQRRANNTTYYGKLCTLEQYLKICRKHKVKAVIEMKWTPGINSSFSDESKRDCANVPALIALIDKCKMRNDVILMTSMKGVLDYIHSNYPDITLQLLYRKDYNLTTDWCKERGISIDQEFDGVNADLVKYFHSQNLKVNCWTVDKDEDIKRMSDFGVDMITTNRYKPKH